MGLFSFIKDAGEKLFGSSKDVEAAQAEPAKLPDLNAKASAAIKTYIETQNLGIQNLGVAFDGATGMVSAFVPRNRPLLLLRNVVFGLMTIPPIAKMAVGRSLIDPVRLPPVPVG